MTTATDPTTGQSFELVGGRWVPITKREAAPSSQDDAIGTDVGYGSTLGAVAIGAGDVLTTVGRNLRELRARMSGTDADVAAIGAERGEADALRARLHREAPIAATVGSALPTLAAAPLGGASVLGQLGAGAAMAAATSPSGEFAQDAALGAGFGALGMGGQNIAQRVWAGRAAMREARAGLTAPSLSQGEREIIEGAQRAGMVLTPGQMQGSKVMRDWEASLSSNPATSEVFAQIGEHNRQQLNRLAARAMGVEGADSVSAEVRAYAEHQLNRRFEDIGARIGAVDVAPLKATIQKLQKDESIALLPRTELDSIVSRFESGSTRRTTLAAGEPDQVTGAALMRERSRIASQMRDAFQNGDSSKGQLLGSVLDSMDDAVAKAAIRTARGDHTAGEALARSYDTAREQWNVLRAMDRGGASFDGNVLPGQAARLVKSGDKGGLWGAADDAGQTIQKRGTGTLGQNPAGDFYDALRFAGSTIGKPSRGDSGTATRMSVQTLLGGGVAGFATQAAKRLAAHPFARWYAGMSPQAAATMAATMQGLRQPGQASGMVELLRQTGVGAGVGAFGGGL